MSITITDIITEFGAYYRAGGQGVKDIRKKILIQGDTDSLFVKRVTNDTRLQGANVQITSVLQAYQDAFTHMGNTTFTSRVADLYPIKIDWEENPTKIWDSWIGFLASNSVSRKDWPIVRYIIEELILGKAKEDWELNGVYKGVLAAVTPGTPLAIGSAINGIKQLINLDIDASKTTPIVLGAVPTDPEDFVDYVEEFVDGIPEEVKPFLQDIAMSQTLFKRFKKGMRGKYNVNYSQVDSLVNVIDTNLKVSGFRSHEGSTKIWTTIKGNIELGTKNPANENGFLVEQAKRMVSIMTDYWKGIVIWQPEYMYTNDVELLP